MDGFAHHVRRRYAPGTVRAYLRDVKEYRDRFGDSLDAMTLKSWRSQLTGDPATKNRKISAIKAWARYRRQRVSITTFRERHKARPLASADAIYRVGGEAGLFLRLLHATGLRVSEALGLQRSSVRDGCLLVMGKRSKERLVPIPAGLRQELLMLGREGRLFPYSYSWAYKAADSAGVRPHDLRHLFATELNERGVNIIALRDLLGHTSTRTTSIYTHPSLETLRAQRDKLGR